MVLHAGTDLSAPDLGQRHHLPPLKGKGHQADVGTDVEVSDVGQVTIKDTNKGSLESQGLQQVTDLFF
jgi:hypothetical protein